MAAEKAKTPYWKESWFPGLVVTVFFLLFANSEPMSRLDWAAYDLGVSFSSGRQADDSLVIISIDDASLQQLGPWPWPRDRFAQVVGQLAAAEATAIGFALPLDTAENRHGLEYLRYLRDEYGENEAAQGALQRALIGLDTDGALGVAASAAGNVVFGMPYRFAVSGRDNKLPVLDSSVSGFALHDVNTNPPFWLNLVPSALARADRLYAPVPPIARGAAAIGHLNTYPAGGENLRTVPLVLQYGDLQFPSFSLLMAAYSQKLDRSQLVVLPGQGVSMKGKLIHTAPNMEAFPRYYRGRDDKSPFRTLSFADVYTRQVDALEFRGKTILIGITASSLVDMVGTPIGERMAPVVASAHMVSSLLNDDLFTVPMWGTWVEVLVIALVGFYLMYVLPRFGFGTGLALSVVLLFLLLNAQFLLMAVQSVWIPLMVPTLVLIFGVVAVVVRRLMGGRATQLRAQLDVANRSLGQMLQSQGQFDLAFEKFRQCAVDDALLDMLYNLGLDFERKRQFSRAVGVFNYIADQKPLFRDSRDRIRLNQEMEKMTALGKGFAGANSASATMAVSFDKLQKPMLGRYQIEREIGRGAMGMVYLGRDPRINRTVAIKTMALAQEFDDEQLAEVKARFFREAETAGRLNHPNIVTVYDVGEEQELAYIAMDYLRGKPLSTWCKFENLLPAEKVFDVMIKVAEALDYAHQHQVVHRDIKPANIMFDEATGVVKVTDFGVACLMDSSKTKTGTVLGSPSYMSPEQLAGSKVDGRSDLFSLGVTFFQLLTGELPFVADSLASLMYKIANEKHVDVRVLRPDLPACVSVIVNRTLYKDVDKRVQSGQHLANALRRCKQQINKEL